MRKWLNEDVLPRLPKELQAMIVPRTIRQMIDGKEVQTQDKLWLPSFTEMFGAEAAAEWTPGDLGDEQFELFDFGTQPREGSSGKRNMVVLA